MLSRVHLLRGLKSEVAEALLLRSRLTLLGSGAVLWRESDPGIEVGVVVSGRLKLVRVAHATESILDVAVSGDALGEEAFALGGVYQSDVVALRRSEILLVPCPAIRELLSSGTASAQALAEDLATQLVRLYQVAEDFGPGGVEQRLARVFLRLADRLGEPFPGGTYIGVRLRRRDLAAMAATTLESTCRHIADWQRRRILTSQPAGYLLHDLAELRRRAEKASEPSGSEPGHR